MQPAEVEPKYAAFISYSHKDEVIARWLHRKLEGFRAPLGLPTVGRQLGKIFRDREEFAAGRDLRSEIQNALRQSNAVVVLCSEHSASSSHVDAEIRFFKETYPDRLIIPVIVGAEPPMCFPPALATGEDRLGADFRPTKDGKHRGYLKVVAGLLGLGLDDLIQRERIARVRRLVLGGAVMAALATAVVSAAYFYDDSVSSGKLSRRSATQVDIIQSDAARARLQARFAAEELARQRETMHEVDERRLITMSRTLSQRDIREAFSAEVVAAAREALWRSDVVDPGSGAPGQYALIASAGLYSDARLWPELGPLLELNGRTGRTLWPGGSVLFRQDGLPRVLHSERPNSVVLSDVTGRVIREFASISFRANFHVNSAGDTALAFGRTNQVALLNLRSGDAEEVVLPPGTRFSAMLLDGQRIYAVLRRDGRASLQSKDRGSDWRVVSMLGEVSDFEGYWGVAVGDGEVVVIGFDGATVINKQSGAHVRSFGLRYNEIGHLWGISHVQRVGGRWLAYFDDGVWDDSNNVVVQRADSVGDWQVATSGRVAVRVARGGVVHVANSIHEAPVLILPALGGQPLSFDPEGEYLLAAADDHVILWDIGRYERLRALGFERACRSVRRTNAAALIGSVDRPMRGLVTDVANRSADDCLTMPAQ